MCIWSDQRKNLYILGKIWIISCNIGCILGVFSNNVCFNVIALSVDEEASFPSSLFVRSHLFSARVAL